MPSALQVNVTLPALKWKSREVGLEYEFRVEIDKSKIDVSCSFLADFDKERHLADIVKRSFDLTRTAVNLVAFAQGYGLLVVFDKLTLADGTTVQIIPEDKGLPQLVTTLKGSADFEQIFKIVAMQPIITRHLADLITAITVPHEAATSCARAIDGLKHLVAQPGSKDKIAWRQMQAALAMDESYLQFISHHSRPGRHGRDVYLDGPMATEITHLSWVIMDRFFEYKKRGDKALPESEFPILKG